MIKRDECKCQCHTKAGSLVTSHIVACCDGMPGCLAEHMDSGPIDLGRKHDLAWYEIWGRGIISDTIAKAIEECVFEDMPRWTHIDENNAIEWLGTRWVDGVEVQDVVWHRRLKNPAELVTIAITEEDLI